MSTVPQSVDGEVWRGRELRASSKKLWAETEQSGAAGEGGVVSPATPPVLGTVL